MIIPSFEPRAGSALTAPQSVNLSETHTYDRRPHHDIAVECALHIDITTPGIATFTAFDPFFGFYRAAIPTTQVLSSYTVNKPGVNGGLGIVLGTKWHGKFFAEARYRW